MMLTKKEADWIRVLIKQVPNDIDYMRPHLRDHHSHFTIGHCERYEEMARWLGKLLEVYEQAIADDAVARGPEVSKG